MITFELAEATGHLVDSKFGQSNHCFLLIVLVFDGLQKILTLEKPFAARRSNAGFLIINVNIQVFVEFVNLFH